MSSVSLFFKENRKLVEYIYIFENSSQCIFFKKMAYTRGYAINDVDSVFNDVLDLKNSKL